MRVDSAGTVTSVGRLTATQLVLGDLYVGQFGAIGAAREHRRRGRISSALRASSFGYRNEATTKDAHLADRVGVEAGRRFAEAQVLQLAHEVDYVTARATSVTHKLARSGSLESKINRVFHIGYPQPLWCRSNPGAPTWP
jgi:hypothetical protein